MIGWLVGGWRRSAELVGDDRQTGRRETRSADDPADIYTAPAVKGMGGGISGGGISTRECKGNYGQRREKLPVGKDG